MPSHVTIANPLFAKYDTDVHGITKTSCLSFDSLSVGMYRFEIVKVGLANKGRLRLWRMDLRIQRTGEKGVPWTIRRTAYSHFNPSISHLSQY